MTPWVTRLIFANVTMFILSASMPSLYRAFALVPAWVVMRPWTLFTYMFLHAGFMHLIFNMIGLFFFGPRLEARLGSRSFVMLYILSGLGGAALSFLFAPGAAVVGASGAVFGVLLGFAMFWPTDLIFVMGVLPLQARWFVIILVALSLYAGLGGAQDGVAHFAHLGGFAGGYLYLKWLEGRAKRWKPATKPSVVQRYAAEIRTDTAKWTSINRNELHEINRAEVDRILEKVSRLGAASLTADERAFMERMSAK